eukprot:CAMPEP_0175676150 /NCGR_PEP_ID=MMETSP0097-20121207/22596_1 /TAXON_ID=311494 /ORGANISM="Alexandrium monilatum, Strain CCMP3105" /LENGTH=115 /DNA_ID=CAMNT_0016982885 /DNA_START=54 /DNA_END=402 /DNA_ORIENTATION=+
MFGSSASSGIEQQLANQLQKLTSMHEQALRDNAEFKRQNQQLLNKNQELMTTIVEQDKRINKLERLVGAYQDEVRTWQSGLLRVGKDAPSNAGAASALPATDGFHCTGGGLQRKW